MSKLLEKVDFELFKKQFADIDEKKLAKLEKNIIFLYEETVEIVQRLIERGFTEDYKGIVAKEWILFITQMMPKIEKVRGVNVGKDKLELLISFAIFIIIKSLPIDPALKEVLIIIIKEFIPEIANAIIFASKNMHTFGSWLKKKCKCMS